MKDFIFRYRIRNYGNYEDNYTLNLAPCDERCNTHMYFKCNSSFVNDIGNQAALWKKTCEVLEDISEDYSVRQ